MNNNEGIQKPLGKITTEQQNLRKNLLNQADAIKRRRTHIMQSALMDGMITDHISDGLCEQLVEEGWLERVAQQAVRPHVSRSLAYVPTEKATQDWQNDATSAALGKSE